MKKNIRLYGHNGSSLNRRANTEALEKKLGKKQKQELLRQGAEHIIAQQIYQLKTDAAHELTAELYDHIIEEAQKLIEKAYELSEESSGNPESDAFFKAFLNEMLPLYKDHAKGLAEIGATNIAREAHRHLEHPEKKGWFGS